MSVKHRNTTPEQCAALLEIWTPRFRRVGLTLLRVETLHTPHPFMVGSQHVVYAFYTPDQTGGMLGEAALRAHPCCMRGCGRPWDEHEQVLAAMVAGTTHDGAVGAKKLIEAWPEFGDDFDGVAFPDMAKG